MNPFPMWHFVIQEHLNSRSIQFCKLFCLFFAFPCMMGTMILYFFFLLKSNVFTFNEEGISISTHLLRPLLTHCESNDRVGVLSLLQNSVVEVVLYDCGTTEYTFTCVLCWGKMPEIIVIEIHPSLDRWRKHLVLQFTARWENVVNIDFRVSSALVIHS
jgi:hypothetical protein